MVDQPQPVIDYTGRDYNSLFAQLQDFIQSSNPDLYTDLFDSNLGTSLVGLVAYVGDLISLGQDVLAQEVFLSTARRLEGPLRFAKSVGYTPRSATGATVVMRSDNLPANVLVNGATVPALTFIVGANDLRYELLEEVIIPPGTNVLTLTMRQGQTFTETFIPTRAARQAFTAARSIVEDDSWSVFVGDTSDPANEWTQVSNVTFETSASQSYEVEFDSDGRLTIRFGDGNAGKIPEGTISLTYRVTEGAVGNAAINTLRGNVQVNVIGGGSTASIPVQNSTGAATGGADREGVEEMRISVPAFVRTVDQVRSLTDYEEGVKINVGGVGLVFADVPLSSFSGNIVRVHVWDTEQVDFTVTSTESGISSVSPYSRYVQVPTTRINAIQEYLIPRTTATVHNVVVRPTASDVDLYLGRVSYDKNLFSALNVHQDIVDAVVALFQNSSGFTIRVADIYESILDVPGVQHFTIERIVWEHIDYDSPPTVIVEEFRTDQDSSGAVGGPFLPLQDLVVPGTAERAFYDDANLFANEITYTTDIDNPNVQSINLRTLNFDLKTS